VKTTTPSRRRLTEATGTAAAVRDQPETHHGAVVRELPAGKALAVGEHRLGELLRTELGAAAQQVVEPLLAVELAVAARLDDSVRVEDDVVPGASSSRATSYSWSESMPSASPWPPSSPTSPSGSDDARGGWPALRRRDGARLGSRARRAS
jgi:hypothetical protein